MRLLHVKTLQFSEFVDDATRPKYVIASHRWTADEASYKEVKDGIAAQELAADNAGHRKVKAFARYVREKVASVDWLWIDTCCINKESDAELSYSINSMFKWYRNAELCLVFLAGVVGVADGATVSPASAWASFEQDEWFRRGWTLQELLAPRLVVFVTKDWHAIGRKGPPSYDCDGVSVDLGPDLSPRLSTITGVPERVLNDWGASVDMSVEEKLRWMEGRSTTRPEDMSYALFGIVGITLSVIYGEGQENARNRVLAALRQRDELSVQHAAFQKIREWLNPPNPWTNHESARKLYVQRTGEWLFESNEYQAWKSGGRHLWLYGGAGCGKTILCSTAIEGMKLYCKDKNFGHAVFYFSFSDKRKQTYEDVLLSLVAQLGYKGAGLSMLQQAYNRADRRLPGFEELQQILLASFQSFDRVFCHLDALDECPWSDGERQRILDGLEKLLEDDRAQNAYFIMTSRDLPDIRQLMEQLDAQSICLSSQRVDADIHRYVSTQLNRVPKLSRLDPTTKTLVEENLTQRSDGMFRWVFCQLQELTKSKSTRPNSVKAALLALPSTLDETYQRILDNIATEDRSFALTILRWLVYSQEPLTLAELAEAGIVNPMDNAVGTVDSDNRCDFGDALEILAGLITTINDPEDDGHAASAIEDAHIPSDVDFSQALEGDIKVRLAHFSVKEYLESLRIGDSSASYFQLEPSREHRFIAQSCLVYLEHYYHSPDRMDEYQDCETFPLLEYAARSWYEHASRQQAGDLSREMRLLTTETYKQAWLTVRAPDSWIWRPFVRERHPAGSALYYASWCGLSDVAKTLVDAGADVHAQGSWSKWSKFPLQAACARGHEDIVRILLDAGAETTMLTKFENISLHTASWYGHENVVRILLDAGADVNALAGVTEYTALHAACSTGHERIVRMLLDAGADVNIEGSFGSALQEASVHGHTNIVRMLLDAGADVNGSKGEIASTLRAASIYGYDQVVRLLLDAGAVGAFVK